MNRNYDGEDWLEQYSDFTKNLSQTQDKEFYFNAIDQKLIKFRLRSILMNFLRFQIGHIEWITALNHDIGHISYIEHIKKCENF